MAEVDLLSKLPEDLLMKILLLIPTKAAMATMILSKQWRSIWRNLPCLDFDITHKNCNNFASILDKSLSQLNEEGPFLQTLSIKLHLTGQCPADLDMEKYVEKAINNRKVVNLKLNLWSQHRILLPKTLYTCKTLVKLSLSHKILLEDSVSSLTCLKTLELFGVRYKDEESIVSFLSNCSVLEVLIVVRSDDDNVKKFMVKVCCLREFSYSDFSTMEDEEEEEEEGDRNLVIDTPSLKRFKFRSWGERAFCKIQTKMPLDYAFIDIFQFRRSPDDNFMKSMASLITLHMFLTPAMVRCCNTVKFSRLTECKLIPNYSDWLKPVMLLLANSPKLKKLSIEHTREAEDICWPFSWNDPSCIPECLSSQLEVFEWEEYGGSNIEKQFFTYILGNGMCLKKINIFILSSPKASSTFEEEQIIMEDLKDIFRVSTTSHLSIDRSWE